MTLQILAKLMQTTGMVLLVGPAFFVHVLWRPFRRPEEGGALKLLQRPLRVGATVGFIVLSLGTIAQMVRIVSPLVAGFPFGMQLGFGWSFVTGSFIGRLQLLLLVGALLSGMITSLTLRVRKRKSFGYSATSWIVAAGVSIVTIGMVVVVVLGGHAVSSVAPVTTVVAQVLHLGSVLPWAGGVLLFASLLRVQLRGTSSGVRRTLMDGLRALSSLGFAAVLAILGSGIVLSLAYVFSFKAGTESLYGRGIGLKTALLVLIIGLAGANRLVVFPRLRTETANVADIFRSMASFLRLEAGAVVIVLSVTAALTQLPPPSTPGFMPGQSWEVEAGPFHVEMAIASETAADVRFDVFVEYKETGRLLETEGLEINLDMPGHFMGIRPILAEAEAPGVYTARSTLSMAGRWEAGVLIPDGDEEHVAVVGFQIASATEESYSRMQKMLMGYTGGAALFFTALFVVATGLTLTASGTGFELSSSGRSSVGTGLGLAIAGLIWILQLGGVALPGFGSLEWLPVSSTGGEQPLGDVATVEMPTVEGAVGLMEEPFRLWTDLDEYLLKLDVIPGEDDLYIFHASIQDYWGDPVSGAHLRLVAIPPPGAAGKEKALDVVEGGELSTFFAEERLEHKGTWQMRAQLAVEESVFQTVLHVPVPIVGAKELLRLADEAMNRLDYLRIREEMRGRPGGTVVTDMLFAAPDRTAHHSDSGREMIVIGDTRYQRFGPEEQWRVGRWPQAAGFRWPTFDYANLGAQEKLLRRDVIDGKDVLVVSLIQDPPDIHYTLWIDVYDHRLHRLDMITTGHYMYWTFHDFNEPVVIDPPVEE